MRLTALLTLLIALIASGCAREENVTSTAVSPQSDTSAVTTAAGPMSDTTSTDTAMTSEATNQVSVRLVDHSIDMPSELPAGRTTFNVYNAGQAEHNFEIEGEGIEQELDRHLKAGETGTLTVDLRPGSYKIYCPVADHEGRGMTMQLTVR